MKQFREFLELACRFRLTPVVDNDFPGMRDRFDFDTGYLMGGLSRVPEVVTLCGSTRFKDAFEEANKRLTLEGKIVLSVGLFGHLVGLDMNSRTKEQLDVLHKRKIFISDSILVLNVGGYIGDSTRSEIEYARSVGVPVNYLEPIEEAKK